MTCSKRHYFDTCPACRESFADCSGHAFWKRDFRGASGLFAFVLDGGTKVDRDRLVEQLKLFGIGFSWGGYESLAIPVDLDRVRSLPLPTYQGPIVRLHVGLEDPDDLIADLDQALAGYPSA